MKFGQGMSADSVEYGMTRGEYFALRGDMPLPDPVSRLLQAIAEAPGIDWMAKAACKGVTGMFYPEDKDRSNYTAAKKLCRACPVRSECAEAGIDEVHGVWGGMSPRERARVRRGRPRPPRAEIVGNVTFRHPPEKRAEAERLILDGWQDSHVSRKVNVPQRTILDWRRALGVKRGPGGVAA